MAKLMERIQELKRKRAEFEKKLEAELKEAEKELGRDNPDFLDLQEQTHKKIKVASGPTCDLKESAPIGSFEYVGEIIRDAYNKVSLFPGNGTGLGWINYIFPEKIIVSFGSKYYEIPFTMGIKGEVAFGKPVEVEQLYVVKEAVSRVIKEGKTIDEELKEASISRIKEAQDGDVIVNVSLKESTFDVESGIVEAILIEAGTNPLKKRHYPFKTIEEVAAKFSGLKMYINHPTKEEEKTRPERDLRDWASTIVESWYDGGKAKAKIAVHDSWLRERLADPIARANIGLSINAAGKLSSGKVNGEEVEIVEKIVLQRPNGPASVDWVTEAGARGRVSRLLKESTTKEKSMELKEATFADLQRENPELAKAVKEAVVKEIKESDETKTKDLQLKEAQGKIAEMEKKEKISSQATKVGAMLKENASLPEVLKERIAGEVSETLHETDEALKEAVTGKVKKELEYLNKLSEKGKIKLASSGGKEGTKGLKESFEDDLSKRMGVGQKEEEETEE